MARASHNKEDSKRNDSLETLPDDLLSQLVQTLGSNLRRPEALVMFTSTCQSFRKKCPLSPTELQRACAAKKLAHSFETRPSTDELQNRGIIKGRLGQSIQFLEAQMSLEKAVVRRFAERALARRPPSNELQAKGIILDTTSLICPRLSLARAELERKMMREQRRKELSSKLASRPSIEELSNRGLLRSA